jgi:adenosylhomocysteine nucleosidase
MAREPIQAAILAALPLEVQPFLRRRRARRRRGAALPLWEFRLPGGRGVAVAAGMGQAAARAGFAWVAEKFQPEMVLAVGFGGAVLPAPAPGEVVLGLEFFAYDPSGPGLEAILLPALPPQGASLPEQAARRGLRLTPGTLVSTPEVMNKVQLRALLKGLPTPVVDLESAVLACLAREQGLPFLALRAVTDGGGEEIPGFIKTAVRQGKTPTPFTALGWLRGDPRRLRHLSRLWHRSRRAAAALAGVLEVVVEVFWGEGREVGDPPPSPRTPLPHPP